MSMYQYIWLEPQIVWLPWKLLSIYIIYYTNSLESDRITYSNGNHGNTYLNDSKYIGIRGYKTGNQNMK